MEKISPVPARRRRDMAEVTVRENNIEKAVVELRRRVETGGVMKILRRKRMCQTRADVRRYKDVDAIWRNKKAARRGRYV